MPTNFMLLANSKDVQGIFTPIVAEIETLITIQASTVKIKYKKEPKVRHMYCFVTSYNTDILPSSSSWSVDLAGSCFFTLGFKTY